MKQLITTILFLIVSILGYSNEFDYKTYAKNYLDSVEMLQVGGGICQDLVYDMLYPIEKHMLMELPRTLGTPVSVGDAQVGDIILYGNHIAVVYSSNDGELKIADQNRVMTRNGVTTVEQFVEIRVLNEAYFNWKSFVIYHPIELKDIELYGEFSKKQLCNLYRIYAGDDYDMNRTDINFDIENKKKLYFFDINCRYTELDWNFAKYFNNVLYGTSIVTSSGRVTFHFLETPNGIIELTKCGRFDKHPVKWITPDDMKSLTKGVLPNGDRKSVV